MSPDVTTDPVPAAIADIPVTSDTLRTLRAAVRLAAGEGVPARPVHVLRALAADPSGLAPDAMRQAGVDPQAVVAASSEEGGTAPVAAGDAARLRPLVVHSMREAQLLGHHQVDPVHLLLALLYSDSPETARPLQSAGLSMVGLRQALADPRAVPGSLRRRPLPRLRGVLALSPVFLAILAITAIAGGVLWSLPDTVLGSDRTPTQAVVTAVIFVLGGWIASVCVHEFGHALTAYLGGDRGVVRAGYLDLNPLRYGHPFISVIIPLMFILLGGFGFPGGAVYINRTALRTKRWETAVALAGPAGTLAFGVLGAAVLAIMDRVFPDVVGAHVPFFGCLAFLVFLEAVALIINLIPIPGLDGYNAIRPWLPIGLSALGDRIAPYGMMLLFLLIWQLPGVVGGIFTGASFMTSAVGVDQLLVFSGQSLFPHLQIPGLNG